jgi:outer membrane lipoprotein-sorting protein
MLRIRRLMLAVCAAAVCAAPIAAQDANPKDVIRKSVAAQGGEKELAKYKAATAKYKGTIVLNNAPADIVGETLLQRPDKLKNVLSLDLGGMKIDITTVYDGKALWVSAGGNTNEVKDVKIRDETRESLRVEGGNLVDFLKEPYEISAIGEAKVKGKDAVGVRVSKKGQRDISYYFDKKTHLPIKTEMRSYQPMTGQEVTQEKFLLDYESKNGLQVPKRIEILHDGQRYMEIDITEMQVLENLDDSTFARP